jgi:hypothetical protein
MVKSIEMKRVEVTLFAFINPPINWVRVDIILWLDIKEFRTPFRLTTHSVCLS